jgi:hypothetical protein
MYELLGVLGWLPWILQKPCHAGHPFKNVDKTRVCPYKICRFAAPAGCLALSPFHPAKNVALQYDDLVKISLFLIRIW